MKTLSQILVLALLTLGSCTSRLYTGSEYDDLYYQSSDKPVEKVRPSVNEQITGNNSKANDYYDNIYAADTLVSDEYSNAVDYNKQIADSNNYDNNGGGYDYYNNYSYAGRLRRFNGNYFDPYWGDPFYSDFGYGYPSFGMGYGGYGYDPYSWNHYYGYDGLYGDYSGGGFGGYYGGFGGYYGGFGGYYGGYGSYFSPYFGYSGYNIRGEGRNSVAYGRRERPSNLSSRWNSNSGAAGYSSQGGTYISTGSGRRTGAVNQSVATGQRKPYSSVATSQQPGNQITNRKTGADQSKGGTFRSNTTSVQRNAAARPSYNSVNRTYTPSYSNPRMSTRPAYNNSRASETVNPGYSRNSNNVNSGRVNSNAGAVRNSSNQGSYQNSNSNSRSNSNSNSGQRRIQSPSGYYAPSNDSRSNPYRGSNSYSVPSGSRPSNSYRSTESYSVPSRSSIDRTGSFSSGYPSGSSIGSRSSSSSYSGSSGSESRSSYSSGSSSSGSSSSGSSSRSSEGSSSSSGGRRR